MSLGNYIKNPTYQSLIDMLKVYLNRDDVDTVETMSYFINAAEKVILRNLRIPAFEKIVKFNIAEDGDLEEGFVNLPSDYLEMKFMWVRGEDATTLSRVTFDQLLDNDNKYHMMNLFRDVESMNTPKEWAINADRVYIRPIVPERSIYMTYYADLPELSEETESNPILELAPDALLYLAVGEGFRFLMEEQKSEYWENQGMKRLMQIKQQVQDAEFSGSPLVISF